MLLKWHFSMNWFQSFWFRKLTLKVRILPFFTTFTQLAARLKKIVTGWLLVLDLKEGLIKCAPVCVKSEVILLAASWLMTTLPVTALHTGFLGTIIVAISQWLCTVVGGGCTASGRRCRWRGRRVRGSGVHLADVMWGRYYTLLVFVNLSFQNNSAFS